MRKALATAGLAALLSMGIGPAVVAMAQESPNPTTVVEVKDDKDGDSKTGLLGLIGLFGLAGFLRRPGGGGGGGGGGRSSKASAPRGGYTTDWSR
ncbi:MAG: hypothetical protein QOE93_2554 [Actinomycetota bacterium]|jgi:hypothetical protein|nr:hypothetical protein [Actinomycetota bacterium]